MRFETVQCLVRIMQDGNPNLLSVMKAGPSSLLVTEIPILRIMNDVEEGGVEDSCVTRVRVNGAVEVTKSNELERLRMRYGNSVVNAAYPGGRGLPLKLSDCELPDECMERPAKKVKEA